MSVSGHVLEGPAIQDRMLVKPALGVALSLALAVPTAWAQQPNFVFLFPDQLRAHDVGCYGEATIRNPVSTPNMDSLAASGLRFHNVCCSLPLCTPCRASVLTGRMPYAVRARKGDTFFSTAAGGRFGD